MWILMFYGIACVNCSQYCVLLTIKHYCIIADEYTEKKIWMVLFISVTSYAQGVQTCMESTYVTIGKWKPLKNIHYA